MFCENYGRVGLACDVLASYGVVKGIGGHGSRDATRSESAWAGGVSLLNDSNERTKGRTERQIRTVKAKYWVISYRRTQPYFFSMKKRYSIRRVR